MAALHFEAVAHRKDGSFVLACSALTGRIWNGTLWVFSSQEDFEQCPNLHMVATRTPAGITDALWLPGDNNILFASDSGELEIWNCHPPGTTLEHQASLSSHDDAALCVVLLADGERIVSGGSDRRIIIWDVEKEHQISSFKGHSDMVLSVASHPSTKDCFISTSLDGNVLLWDIRKPRPASKFTGCKTVVHTSVTWSNLEQNSVAIGSQGGHIEVLDMRATDSLFLVYYPHSRAVHRLAYSPWNPTLIASVSDDTGVWVHCVENNRKVLASSGHTDFVRGLSWHCSEPKLITCGWDGQVLQHSINTSVQASDADQKNAKTTTSAVIETLEGEGSDVSMETASLNGIEPDS